MTRVDLALRLAREAIGTVVVLWLLLAVAVLTSLTNGCGSAAQQHHALNAVANVANPSYDLAITACFEAEDVIIEREGTTFAQDVAATEAVRSACDRVFAGFDALRVAQRVARAAVDGGGEALVTQALAELQEAWTALRRLLPEVEGLVA